MKNERELLEEDLNIVLDEIEYYNELLRRYEHFGEPLPDDETLDGLERHLTAMENEAMYLQACLEN